MYPLGSQISQPNHNYAMQILEIFCTISAHNALCRISMTSIVCTEFVVNSPIQKHQFLFLSLLSIELEFHLDMDNSF